MPEPIAKKRRSLQRALWVASVVAAAPFSMTFADQPSRPASRDVPKRLPTVKIDTATHPRATDTERLLASDQSTDVQPCSAELDALVDSWFSEVDAQAKSQSKPQRWLRSTSSTASAELARRLIAQATREYEVGVWLSAETSAWQALSWAAESVDLSSREKGKVSSPTCVQRLQTARESMREARDFAGAYGPLDSESIQRMAISHQTDLLDHQPLDGLTATDASDRYLDHARVLLAPLAQQSTEAAQALDLLAAIYLRRADAKTLPSATALCLRRAALQGQPNNASLASRLGMHLADLGLLEEARWALEHSLAIRQDVSTANSLVRVLQQSGHEDEATRLSVKIRAELYGQSQLVPSGPNDSSPAREQRLPEIVELSPQEFASISRPVMLAESATSSLQVMPTAATIATDHPARSDEPVSDSNAAPDSSEDDPPGMIRRFFRSFKRVW